MIPDAPDIQATERTGYPTDVKWPRCPVCGQECETVYKVDGYVVACDQCVEEQSAWEWEEENE